MHVTTIIAPTDDINMKVEALNAGSTTNVCHVSVGIAAASGSSYDAIVSWGQTSGAPQPGGFCGPSEFGAAAQFCAETDVNDAAFVVPRDGNLSGLTAHLDALLPAGVSYRYVVRNVTTGEDADLAVTVDENTSEAVSTRCTTRFAGRELNCGVHAGDFIVVRADVTGTAVARAQNIVVTIGGLGEIVTQRIGRGDTEKFAFVHDAGAAAAAAVYPMERSGRVQRLFAYSNGNVTQLTQVQVCAGTDSAAPCPTPAPTPLPPLSCTIANNQSTCSNLIDGVPYGQGEFVVVRVGAPGGAAADSIGFSMELQ